MPNCLSLSSKYYMTCRLGDRTVTSFPVSAITHARLIQSLDTIIPELEKLYSVYSAADDQMSIYLLDMVVEECHDTVWQVLGTDESLTH